MAAWVAVLMPQALLGSVPLEGREPRCMSGQAPRCASERPPQRWAWAPCVRPPGSSGTQTRRPWRAPEWPAAGSVLPRRPPRDLAEVWCLIGQRRGNRRLRRRLARAPEAAAGRPVGRSLPWERRASQSCQARPEEAQKPSWGTARGAV
eukprot:scaffold21413_cov48-Phaeocystis_antarctica.AAC.3